MGGTDFSSQEIDNRTFESSVGAKKVVNPDGSAIGGDVGFSVQVTPTVATAAYVAGDSIGGGL